MNLILKVTTQVSKNRDSARPEPSRRMSGVRIMLMFRQAQHERPCHP
jgi:hypothetical protein